MRASIIIANYNSKAYLEDCLRTLQREMQPDDEVVIVDNASQDGSINIAQKILSQANIICNASNRGFAAACNQGAAVADGEFLVFLNQDTRVEPGWLNGLLEALKQKPQVGLVTSKLLLMSRVDQIQMCGQDVHFTGLVFGRGFLQPSSAFSTPGPVGAVSGASFAIGRELWQRLGGFDEDLFMYYEETDLCWRAKIAGYDSLFMPASVVYHDYRPGQPGKLALYYTRRNRYIMLFKSYRWQTLFLISPSLLVAELLEWAYAVQCGRAGLGNKFAASIWLVRHLPVLLRWRAQAQKNRSGNDLALLNNCVDRITPVEFSGGTPGRYLSILCNFLFHTNYSYARFVLRGF